MGSSGCECELFRIVFPRLFEYTFALLYTKNTMILLEFLNPRIMGSSRAIFL